MDQAVHLAAPRQRRSARLLTAIAAGMLVALVASGPTFAATGRNNLTAKACQKGGWTSLQTSGGDTFGSQDACVAYGASGGSLFRPSVVANPDAVHESEEISVSSSGFTPNSTADLTVTNASGSVTFLGLPTDQSGALATFSSGFSDTACEDGQTSVTFSVIDANGLQASDSTTLLCP